MRVAVTTGSRARTGRAGAAVSASGAATTIVAIKWHLLVGGLRGTTQQRVQTWLAVVVASVVGCLAAGVLALIGQAQGVEGGVASALVVVLLPASVIGIAVLSAATGVESSLDPRHLATEPIGRWGFGLGVLAAAAVGPPALIALGAGAGLVIGWGRDATSLVMVLLAVVAWWLTLLVASRSLASALGVVATGRFRQMAQSMATLAAVGAWLAVQVVAGDPARWSVERWQRLADLAMWTPPGQLGRAIAVADQPGQALVHLGLGAAWIPALMWVAVAANQRLVLAAPRLGTPRGSRRRSVVDRAEGLRLFRGPVGAVASRTLRTKFRTPRQSVNTLTALAVGAGALVATPFLLGGEADPRLVLLGGLLHLAVLFDGNNAFGMDGPPIWMEVASGVDSGELVRGKVLASVVVMAVPAALVPLALALLTGGWDWLLGGWLVAVGSVAAAAGVAVLSASVAPVAMPDSPNPLAGGDTGQGCVAGIVLVAGVTSLALATAPVVLAVGYASTVSAGWATVAALSSPVIGATVLGVTAHLAAVRLAGREDELVHLVTPSR